MKAMYETKISDKRWMVYDVLGNIGWIAYYVCLVLTFVKYGENLVLNILSVIPAAFILLGLGELISERIAKLDRVLSRARLLRGFGALMLGSILAGIVSVVAVAMQFNVVYLIMLIGSVLCGVFAGLLFGGYKKQKSTTDGE